MDRQVIINLINTIIRDGQDATWCDSDIIEQLICCGLTEQDFIEYGFGDFVADYFKEPEEYIPSSSNGDYSPSNPWDAPGMKMSDFI
jgi:hypothetical protein